MPGVYRIVQRALAFQGLLALAPPLYFFVLWKCLAFWRGHKWLAWGMIWGTFALVAAAVIALRQWTFGWWVDLPTAIQAIGWAMIAAAVAVVQLAQRQIGFRTRTFAPLLEPAGRIELRTTGPYGFVRHPIYAAGSAGVLGAFLASGYPAVLVAWLTFTGATPWFARREEEALMAAIDDPRAYERYRRAVPALIPTRRRRPR